jgi:hypothetical protein
MPNLAQEKTQCSALELDKLVLLVLAKIIKTPVEYLRRLFLFSGHFHYLSDETFIIDKKLGKTGIPRFIDFTPIFLQTGDHYG